jgi:hypothetical protein
LRQLLDCFFGSFKTALRLLATDSSAMGMHRSVYWFVLVAFYSGFFADALNRVWSSKGAHQPLRAADPSDLSPENPCKIVVIGVGGGGGNAVNRMIETAAMDGVEC